MYYPQAYHHIQEIQKYNIQDYRPRSVAHCLLTFASCAGQDPTVLMHAVEWSNSKRLSGKYGRSSVCASNVDMPSLKQMSRRQEYCKLTTRRANVAGMARWRVRGIDFDDHYIQICLQRVYTLSLFPVYHHGGFHGLLSTFPFSLPFCLCY